MFFAAVAAATWGPALFANGFVLLGDMVFTPAMHPPASLLGPVSGTVNVTLVYNAAWLLSRVTGAVLLQKLVLLGMGFLPGYLMYRFVPCRGRAARLFAGTVYQVNPFVYTRMLMGQWGLLLAYALLPVAVASTLKTVREPGAGRCAKTALWLSLICVLSLHMGAIALLACLVAALFEMVSRRPAGRAVVALAAVFLIFALISAFWLVPALRGSETTASIDRTDLEVFRTSSTSRAGTWLSVLGMYGYWKAQIDSLMPRGYVPAWPALAIGFILLALYGFWSFRKDPELRPLVRAMLVLGVLGFFLSLGSRAPVTGPLFTFLYDHVGLFRLFREPQKFVALLALPYTVLGGLAVDRLSGGRASETQQNDLTPILRVVPALLIALVCFYSFMMFGGLWGQARAVSYPKSWEKAQEMLERDAGDWRALYLPPYWFMRFDFTGHQQTITSPMPFYFTNRYVQLNTLQVGPVQIDSQRIDRYVQAALDSARQNGNLGAMLAPLNVRYVVMPLIDASTSYAFVEQQEDLKVVRRWSDLVLLKNRVRTSHLGLASAEGSWRSLAQLGKLVRGGDLLGSYLPRGSRTEIPEAEGEPVAHEDSRAGTRVEAELPGEDDVPSTLLLSETYDPGWKLDGSTPAVQAGVTCAFPLDDVGGETVRIAYDDSLVVACYVASAAGLLLCVVLLALDAFRSRRDEDGQKEPAQ